MKSWGTSKLFEHYLNKCGKLVSTRLVTIEEHYSDTQDIGRQLGIDIKFGGFPCVATCVKSWFNKRIRK